MVHFEVASVWLAWPSRRGAFVIAWSRVYGCLCGAVARAKALCSQRCGNASATMRFVNRISAVERIPVQPLGALAKALWPNG